jgi:hypothetical protein
MITAPSKAWIGVGALVVTATAWFLSPGRTAEENESVAATRAWVPQAHSPVDIAAWWTATGGCSSASIWLGPVVEFERGRLNRLWTMVLSDPGTAEPLVCLQGTVQLDDAEPIHYRSATTSIEVRPREGLRWGEVIEEGEFSVTLEGLIY